MNGVVAVAGEIAPVQPGTPQAAGLAVSAFADLVGLVLLLGVALADPLIGAVRT